MSSNILATTFKESIPSDLIRQISQSLGESSGSIISAFDQLATILSAGVTQLGSTRAAELFQNLTENSTDINTFTSADILQDQSYQQKGSSLISFLFKNNQSQIVDHIASASGLRTSSSSTLLKTAAPVFASVVLRLAQQQGSGFRSLAAFLGEQQEAVTASISQTTKTIVTMNENHPTPTEKSEMTDPLSTDRQSSTLSKILPWIVLLIAALGLFYFLEKGTNTPPEDPKPATQDTTVTEPVRDQAPDTSLADTTWMVDPDTIR